MTRKELTRIKEAGDTGSLTKAEQSWLVRQLEATQAKSRRQRYELKRLNQRLAWISKARRWTLEQFDKPRREVVGG